MNISDFTDKERAIVKQLRIETGYGIMDVAKAYCEAEGDIEKAKKILKTYLPSLCLKKRGLNEN